MREIKFRAWDKEEKKMYQCVIIGCTQKDRWNPLIYTDNHIINSLENDYELMQYTGLKDKYGKELYEGDIVKVEMEEYEYPKGYVGVEYNAKVYFKKGAFYLGDKPLKDFLDCNIDIKVIGNIYENSGLLER